MRGNAAIPRWTPKAVKHVPLPFAILLTQVSCERPRQLTCHNLKRNATFARCPRNETPSNTRQLKHGTQ
eukprot:1612127-Pyramimonas_sp.AAC.1